MKKARTIPVIMLFVVLLLSCGSSTNSNLEKAFIGKWHSDSGSDLFNYSFDFKKDGTVEIFEDGEMISAKWNTGETAIKKDGKILHYRTLEITTEDDSYILLYSNFEENNTKVAILYEEGEDLLYLFDLYKD